MNELNRLYESILQALGCKISEQGKVTLLMLGKEYPLRIDGRDLYLPISEALAGNTNEKVYYHPTCESIVSKETEVFKLNRRLAGIRLMSVFRSMIPILFDISSRKEKKSWAQAVYDVISPLSTLKKSVKDEVLDVLGRMNVEVEDGVDNRFIHFKVTKGGKGEANERVYYKAKPSFPLYDVLVRELARSEGQPKNTTVKVNNFSISREAIEIVVHLFRSIIPAVNNPDGCEYDANIPIAARYTAFMNCFGAICEQINRAQNMFRGEFDKKSIYVINLSWQEMMEEIPEFYRQVPELDYNSHNVYKEGEQSAILGGNLDNLLSITSTQVAQPGQVVQGQVVQQGDQIRNIGGEEYNFKIPEMLYGDRYLRSEVNTATQRVHHYAMDMQNQMVRYVCSRMGNFLQRESMAQQMGYGYPNNGYPATGYVQTVMVDQYGRQIPQPNGYNNGYPNNGYGYQQPAPSANPGSGSSDMIEPAW